MTSWDHHDSLGEEVFSDGFPFSGIISRCGRVLVLFCAVAWLIVGSPMAVLADSDATGQDAGTSATALSSHKPKDSQFQGRLSSLWREAGNWSSAQLPGEGSIVNIHGNKKVVVDYPAGAIDTLYLCVSHRGHKGAATLNIVGGGSLTVNGESDWSYFGEDGLATVSLSGDGRLVFHGKPVLFHHSGAGQACVNISDSASLVVDDNVQMNWGKSRTRISGGTLTAGNIVWDPRGDNVIQIAGSGALRVKQSNYPVERARADQEAGRIKVEDAQILTVTINGEPYTQIKNYSIHANTPSPADRQTRVAANVALRWHPPRDVSNPSYRIYLDTSPRFLANPSRQSIQDCQYQPEPALAEATDYYWRVDVTDNTTGKPVIHEGPVWHFTTLGRAAEPIPSDGARDVVTSSALSWSPDQIGLDFDVYFGTDAGRVGRALKGSLEYLGRTAESHWILPKSLDNETKYYWRVDQVSKDGTGRLWKGALWRFATIRQPRTFHVSPNGSDSAPGTQAQPFRTIGKAASLLRAGDTCLIRAGTYRETVRPAASGLSHAPITFRAYPGEQAIITGADLAPADWSVHQGNIFKASIEQKFTQLFVDGVMMNEARWPNMAVHGFFDADARATAGNGDTLHIFDSRLPPGDWTGAIVNVVPADEWIAFTRRIAQYVPGKSLTFDAPSPRAGEGAQIEEYYRPRRGNPYHIYGALAGLDSPGEWYLDAEAKVVYLWTPDGTSPANHRVEVRQRGYAFDLGVLSHILIKDLSLFAAGIDMRGHHCLVDGCTALYVNHFCEAPVIHAWPLGTPNVMAGRDNEWRNSVIAYSADDGIKVHGERQKVTNCLIHEVAYTGVYGACINASAFGEPTRRCEFTRNTMFNSGRFIIFHNGMEESLIRYNHMFNTGLLTRDAGITYSSFAGWNNDISYNWAHDHMRPAGSGLYLDEFQPPQALHHNVIWNCVFGIQMNINNNHPLPAPDTRFYNNTVISSSNISHQTCFTNNGDNGCFINNVTQRGKGKVWRRDSWEQWKMRERWAAEHPRPEDGLARINETDRHNLDCPLDNWLRPPSGSPAIDTGEALPPLTDGYAGSAPDIGAYERDDGYWLPGSTLDPRAIFSYLPGSPSPIERTEPPHHSAGVPISLSRATLTFVPRMKTDGFEHATISGGLRFAPAEGDGTTIVTLPIIGTLEHDTTYTVTIPASVRPVEGVRIFERDYKFTFSTALSAPRVVNLPATEATVTMERATLRGQVLAGGPSPHVTLFWGPVDGGTDPQAWTHRIELGPQVARFSAELSQLTPGKTYFYRCLAGNSQGQSWASESSRFATLRFDPAGQRFFTGVRGARWDEEKNWSPAGVPGAGGLASIYGGRTVTIDRPVGHLDVLFIATAYHGGPGSGTLNIIDNGSLIVDGESDWSYVGESNGRKATLNLSGHGFVEFRNNPVLFYHSGDGEALINIRDQARMVVVKYIELRDGRSTTTITGKGTLIAGDLIWGKGRNEIRIGDSGQLLVRGENYPQSAAEADIRQGRITGADLAVSSTKLGNTTYTRVAIRESSHTTGKRLEREGND